MVGRYDPEELEAIEREIEELIESVRRIERY